MGTTDVEALLLRIEASASKLEKDMAKANLIFDRGAKRMEAQAKSLGAKIGGRLGASIADTASSYTTRIATVVAAAFSADKVLEASQAYIRATNALKVAGLSGAALSGTFDRLYAIAQANSTPIETLVGLYSKAAQAQRSLGASSDQLIGFSTAVAQALRVSGQSAEEAQGALLQLGQAISGTNVQAEEYNSLIDGAYPLLQAAASGIKEAGGDVAKLTQLVKAGEVSSRAFFYGVLAGAPVLTDKLAGSTKTASQAWTEFQNALTKAVGEIDAATGATANFSSSMSDLAKWVGRLPELLEASSSAWASFKTRVNEAAAAFNAFLGYNDEAAMRAAGLVPIAEARAELAKATLLAKSAAVKRDRAAVPESSATKAAKARIASAFGVLDEKRAADQIRQISLKDHPASTKAKGGAGGSDENDYTRTKQRIEEHTAAMKTEIDTLGLEEEAKIRARKAQELKTAADRAGISLTPEMVAEIDRVSAAYAAQQVALEKAEEAQRRIREQQRYLAETFADGLADLVVEGRSFADVAEQIAKSLAKAAIQAALLGSGPLAGLFGTSVSSSGGLLGSLFKSLLSLDEGGWTGGGARRSVAGVVHGQEYVVRAGVAKKYLPLLEAINRGAPGFASGGFVGSTPSMPLPALAPRASARSGRDRAPITVAMTVQVADAASFRKSQTQIAAEMVRALRRGQRVM